MSSTARIMSCIQNPEGMVKTEYIDKIRTHAYFIQSAVNDSHNIQIRITTIGGWNRQAWIYGTDRRLHTVTMHDYTINFKSVILPPTRRK